MIYIKNYNKIQGKHYHGQTYKQAFDLELECYLRINGSENFPKLLDYDQKNLILKLEDAGIELRPYILERKQLGYMSKRVVFDNCNINNQLENIFNILKKNNITHLDCYKGQNIFIKQDKIKLIDFNIAILDETPSTNELSQLYQNFNNNGGYDWLLKKLKRLLIKNFNY
jgi:hypothetical protein